MYERLVVYAIQNDKFDRFESRYLTYSSKAERDKTFAFMKKHGHTAMDHMTPVTLTITASSEIQLEMEM